MQGSDHEELLRLRDWRHEVVIPALVATREQLKAQQARLDALEPKVARMVQADEIAEAVTEKMTAARRGLLTTGEKLGGACVGAAAIASVVLQLIGH